MRLRELSRNAFLALSADQRNSETSPDPSKLSFAEDAPVELLSDFVTAAHDNVRILIYPSQLRQFLLRGFQDVKALVSVGGWTGMPLHWLTSQRKTNVVS